MNNSTDELKQIAKNIRVQILQTAHYKKQGHVGGSLSATDILTVLYFDQLKRDETVAKDENRDRFVLSKGHVALGLYCTFAELGWIEEEELKTFDQFGSRLQAHPDMTKLPFLDMSTGSLGQGVSTAVGMAIAAKHLEKDFHVFAVIGDGESQEGQVWESVEVAARYELDNFTLIVDQNKLQQFGWGKGEERQAPDLNLCAKLQSFGFDAAQIDGHDVEQLRNHLAATKTNKNGRPKAIVASTVKGKGISFMENNYVWHSKAPNDAELALALAELNEGEGIK